MRVKGQKICILQNELKIFYGKNQFDKYYHILNGIQKHVEICKYINVLKNIKLYSKKKIFTKK